MVTTEGGDNSEHAAAGAAPRTAGARSDSHTEPRSADQPAWPTAADT
jgi:hypothetical protein